MDAKCELERYSGTDVAHYEYDAFGKTVASTGSYKDANPFRFSTKFLDTETDMHYYGFRYCAPSEARRFFQDESS